MRRMRLAPRAEGLEDRQLLATDLGPVTTWNVHNSLLVRFLPDGPAAAPLLRDLAATIVQRYESGPVLIGLVPGMDPTAALTQFQLDPDVLYAQPNRTVTVQRVPNDPQYPNQYALASVSAGINAAAGWDIATGDPSVVVAVTDTGLDLTHPDLYLKVAIRQDRVPTTIYGMPSADIINTDGLPFLTFSDLNSLDANGQVVRNAQNQPVNAAYTRDLNSNGRIDGLDLINDTNWLINNTGPYRNDLVGWNFINETRNPTDDHNHGTFCSGIIGASTNNALGVAGVSWGARILPMKFIGSNGEGTDADAVQSIEYAADYGAKVINASWGDSAPSPAVLDAIRYAGARGSIFVAAAGNSGVNLDTNPFYPAWYREPTMITVASTNSAANLSGFSNWSPNRVDLGAPGENVLSTTRGGGYGFGSGTSYAAPQVVGALAVLAGRFPTHTAPQLVQQLVTNTRPLNSLAGRTITGGILDLARALTPPAQGAPPVSNSGFEQVSVGPPGSFQYNPLAGPWTFTGTSGISTNGSAFTSGNPNAPEGAQVAFLQGPGQATQTIAAWPAGNYAISFFAAQRGNWQPGDVHDVEVLVDGTLVDTIRPTSPTYLNYTTRSFTVTAGTHTIALRGRDSMGVNSSFVDAVSIAQVVTPNVPVADPGFEQVSAGPPGSASSFVYNPAGSPWTFTGTAGITANGSAFTSGNPPAPQGGQVAFLQGPGQASQTIANWAAGNYAINFSAAQRGNWQPGDVHDVEVLVDGAVVDTIRPTSPTYTNFSTRSFAVTAGSHTITLRGRDTSGVNTSLVDAVSVAQVVAPSLPVPDPGFEQVSAGPPGSASSYIYNPAGSPWTFAGTAGITSNGSAFTSGNPPAPQGGQVAFLQGTGMISQSIPGWQAGFFTINFAAAQRGNWLPAFHEIDVLVDGAVVSTIQPTDTTYRRYATSRFVVTVGAHTIAFRGRDTAGGANTVLLDDITVVSA